MNAMDDTFIKDKDPMKSIVENLVQNIKDEALKRAQVVNACALYLLDRAGENCTAAEFLVYSKKGGALEGTYGKNNQMLLMRSQCAEDSVLAKLSEILRKSKSTKVDIEWVPAFIILMKTAAKLVNIVKIAQSDLFIRLCVMYVRIRTYLAKNNIQTAGLIIFLTAIHKHSLLVHV